MLRLTGNTDQNYTQNIYTVYLYDDQYTGATISTCIIASGGLQFDRPTIANKFIVIRAGGCSLTLVSEYPDQYDWLYTAELQRFRIVVKENQTAVFEGYLTTEQFSTDMSKPIYGITFLFNNGLNILKRYKLTDDNGNRIKGQVMSQWDILKYCLKKLNYQYLANLYVCLSTTSSQVSLAASQTVLHKTYNITDNFYDEENQVVSCGDAINIILGSYTAFLQQVGNNLYITDNNTIINNSSTFKKYRLSDFAYLGSENINLNLGDLSDYDDSQVQKDLVSSFNSVKLNYSPYYSNLIFAYQTSSTDITVSGSSANIGTNAQYKFKYNYYLNSNIVNHSGTTKLAMVDGTGSENQNKSEFVLIKQQPSTNGIAFDFNYEFPFLIVPPKTFHKLKIGLSAYFRTKDAYQCPNNVIPTYSQLFHGEINVQIIMGQYIYQNNTVGSGRWDIFTGGTGQYYRLSYYYKWNDQLDYTIQIGDQWMLNKHNDVTDGVTTVVDYILIPLYQSYPDYLGFSEKFNFKILDSYATRDNNFNSQNSHIKDIWINKIEISILDRFNQEISQTDVQFDSYMNPDFENQAPEMRILNSDSVYNVVGEKGALYYSGASGYDFINTHTRASMTANLSKLYLRSWLSNYRDFTNSLTAVINKTPVLLGHMTYNQTPGKKYIITGIKSAVKKNQHQITLMEILPDSEPITEV